MSAVFVGLVLIVAVAAAVFIRKTAKRARRLRRVRRCEASVATSMKEGRLLPATGEVLLQHLEGLGRECSGENGAEG